MRSLVLLATALSLTACATVPMAPPTDDARAKQFEAPAPGTVALYLYRHGVIGGGASFAMSAGQRALGQLASDTYLRVDIPAGRLDVRCAGGENSAAVIVEAVAGSTHFVEVTASPGLTVGPRCNVAEVPAAAGHAAVLAGSRALEIQ